MRGLTLFSQIILVLIFCLICYGKGNRNASENVESVSNYSNCTQQERTKGEKWVAMETNLKNMLSYASRIAIRSMDPEDVSKISTKCFSNLLKIAVGLRQLKMWAFRFLDMMGKIPDGVARGRSIALGHFDGCLDITVTESLRGKSCIIELIPPLPKFKMGIGIVDDIHELKTAFAPDTLLGRIDAELKPYYEFAKLRLAICAPSSCSQDDLNFLAKRVLGMLKLDWDVKVHECQMKEKIIIREWDEYLSLIVIGLTVFLALSGTTLDIIMSRTDDGNIYRQTSGIFIRILSCFSLRWNTEKLYRQNNTGGSIRIINGMKVISFLWIVLSHTCSYLPQELFSNGAYVRDISKNFAFQVVMNGFVAVDTFFFIGGFLLMRTWLRTNAQKISIFMYIFRRVWRLGPPLMFTVAVQLLIYKLGSGPMWHIIYGQSVNDCREKWWATLFFFNNFYGVFSCLGWTWFVAVDMQLYIVSLVILMTIKKHPNISLAILAALSLTSIAATAWNQIHYALPPILSPSYSISKSSVDYYLKNGYARPYVHGVVYFTGLAFGYVIHYKSKIRISSTINVIGWFVSLTSGLAVLYSSYIFIKAEEDPTLLVSATYIVVVKITWSLCLGWVVVSCCTGNGGFITSLLSWSPFTVLSKLTYVAYLVHPIIELAFYGSSRVPIQMDNRTIVFYYFGFVMSAFTSAYFLSMLFEAPFMLIEKLMFQTRAASTSAVTENGTTNFRDSNHGCEE